LIFYGFLLKMITRKGMSVLAVLFMLFQVALIVLAVIYQTILTLFAILWFIPSIILKIWPYKKMFWKHMNQKHVVIVGGGFAGTTTARLLENYMEVTLIDQKNTLNLLQVFCEHL